MGCAMVPGQFFYWNRLIGEAEKTLLHDAAESFLFIDGKVVSQSPDGSQICCDAADGNPYGRNCP